MRNFRMLHPAPTRKRQNDGLDATADIVHRHGALQVVAQVRTGIEGVGAIISHYPEMPLRDGDGAEVLAATLLGANAGVYGNLRWIKHE